MSSIIIQTFLVVLVFGGFIIIVVVFFRALFAPRKISALKNYVKNKNYKAAMNVAKDILVKDKSNPEAHFYLGEAYYNLEKYELALLEYKFAERTGNYEHINEKQLREKLAELHDKTGNYEEALKEYVLLCQNYENESFYFFKCGELFEKKNLTQQAIKYYSDSLKINSSFTPALLNIGVLLYDIKNYTESDHYLQKLLSKEPDNYKGTFYLGMLKKKESNYKVALKLFEKSQKDKDYKARSLMERGMIYIMQNKYEEAVIELDRSIRYSEEENNLKLNAKYLLADCYEKMRNITDAIALWEDIYAKKPNFRDVSAKLSNYQELRMDDRMKDFLTATDDEFYDICKGIIDNMGLNAIDQQILSRDTIQFYCLESDSKWRNIKKKPKLLLISRRNEPIDESVVRQVHETMREKGVIRGIIITSSSFSKLAVAFAKERPIELIDKDRLKDLLKEINV